jgi:polyisoprenoid-binding protein YceI
MRLHVKDGSRVFIDLRATGLLRAVAHSPTLTARPERVTVDLAERAGDPALEAAASATAGAGHAALAATVEASFAAAAIEAPADISASDREKMVDNVRGPDVLDAARFPTIDFRGRYEGTLEGGTLSGDLHVRGVARRVSMRVRVAREAGALVATGAWEGRLTDLGIRPFKALLGAIKLEDRITLRLEARFEAPAG